MQNNESCSALEARLRRGDFVVTVELLPPRGPSFDSIYPQLEVVKRHRLTVAAVNVTDNASARVRVSGLAACKVVIDEGLEPVFQVACRDRNRIAMQSDLLAACAFGVRNVFCVTGDFVTFGDDPEAKPVYDLDSIQLLHVYNRIRQTGRLSSGVEVRETSRSELVTPKFFLGATENPFSDPVEVRVRRLHKKQQAGAQFIQTQCIFDTDRMERFMELVCEQGLDKELHILGGIMPVKSHRPLEFIRDNIPGIRVPDALINRMKNAKNAEMEGIEVAAETVESLRSMSGVSGIHLMTVRWHAAIEHLLIRSGLTQTNELQPTP
ncbi:MAG: hypothetical protein AUJ92_10415 [Armatimonadetes bacterium CG2_30_59_28]|nr:MAG: hypothetical protein AUJ92_10415 [Armatimonadetes bacterium CG2_30_59_28]